MADAHANTANPLFCTFIKEILDTAIEHNSKGITVYKRAYASMKSCPIRLSHPSEAAQLNGIGPGLVARLATALAEYCEANNEPMPSPPKRRRRPAAGDTIDEPEEERVFASRKKTKPYVPQLRSGGYALLVALWEANETGELCTKQQLCDRAQKHSNSSFTAPAHAGQFYTAWNSMKTLVEKGLVCVQGNPKRYRLSDSGVECAEAVDKVRRKENGEEVDEGLGIGVVGTKRPAKKRKTAQERVAEGEDCEIVPSEMAMDLMESARARGPARAPTGPARTSRAQRSPSPIESDDNPDSDEEIRRLQRQRARLQATYANGPARAYGEDTPPPEPRRPAPRQPSPRIRAPARSRPVPRSPSLPTIVPASRTSDSRISASRTISLPSRQPTPPIIPSRSHTVPIPFTVPHLTPHLLSNPTITLSLDTREIRSTTDRSYLQDALTALNHPPHLRALSVGDFLWTATSGPHTVVLPFIVERKRLDDLISSIKDGRFHEQKTRLKKSGIPNIIYIIEDKTIANMSDETATMIDTAIGAMQVADGFFVKRTAKLDDTIRYLVGMTEMLREMYCDGKIAVVPQELVDFRTYTQLLTILGERHPELVWCPEYETFSELVAKSGSTTLRDVFLKMLMCVKGVSIEKARVVQEQYGTPQGLVEAYRKWPGEKRDMVMKSCAGVIERRRIGAAASERIWEVWGKEAETR